MTFRLWLNLMLLCALVLMGISTTAQEEEPRGSGVIVESNPAGILNTPLNPLRCVEERCVRITNLLYPTLYGVDAFTRYTTTAASGNTALVLSAAESDENTQILTLRDDLTWSDGTPVTAYDVLYSYQAIISGQIISRFTDAVKASITAARVRDTYHIEFAYSQVDCTLEFVTNFPVVPAHMFDPSFVEKVTAFGEDTQDIFAYQEAWFKQYQPREFRVVSNAIDPIITLATPYHVDSLIPFEELRIVSEAGQQAYILRDLPSGLDHVDAFLSGEANLLFNPPYADRADLLAQADVQISQYPSLTGYVITLNTAYPYLPENAFDEENQPIDQGFHPIFGDVRVRQAFQQSLDIETLIEIAFQGYGIPLVSSQIPDSWAYSPLDPVPFDFSAAEDLLYEAGWRDIDSDGTRECSGCLYAFENQDLYFEMIYPSGMEGVATYIQRQLAEVGFQVNIYSAGSDEIENLTRQQGYDAALTSFTEMFPVNPDQSARFTRAGDVVGIGQNTGSYYNPRIEELMEQARTVPGCGIAERTAIYQEIQAILQQDQPYIWLFVPQDMVVAAGGVLSFDPLPNQPFWNIQDWVIVQ